MINLTPEHVASKKKVGELKGKPVFEIKTTGGWNLVAVVKDGAPEVIGTGSHRAISRHIAEKREPEIEWSELSKADYISPECFEFLLPQYEALTNAIRAMQGYSD